ncbi:NAD(P)-dependent oxidoreductase [Lentzea flaviverrucosa]|uniref:Phosphoglycerate dehydrogenase n=1 Tax=Lentzea flaviverrucosa TaxID=200379 RepID=A0A1H9XKT4_9PSEU|nr:NAD(P)-dependent oxidoreductase [Lentzea flaviverrucosa]RDI20341.1 phosphoglycerate dehydrogenase-like enzyme [Lentzea flaviverrucosa]SES46659.1 Phosphoglycerate dehydrogenase [Lentzea flaviverrucosa]
MPATILVSNEPDDRDGYEYLKAVPGLMLSEYDPNNLRIEDSQREAELLMPPYRGSHRPLALIGELPSLRMVQLLSAGVDEWRPHVPEHVVVASARGAHAGPVSEWVLSAILTQYRQWPALVRFQDEQTWAHRRFHADTLSGKRVLILGAGSIGSAVARKLEAFGTVSTLVASQARDGVYGPADLLELVPGHAIVVVTAPLTDSTLGIVSAQFLAAMDDGALLVNAGRGQIVDTSALVGELQTGRLRAALDVTDPEPLPSDHPLWRCTGAVISPHAARTVPGTNRLCYEVAAGQIATFLEGGTPTNAAYL